MQTSSDSFLHGIPWKTKEPGTSFQATFFVEFFDKKCSFVILHELAKFNYQTLFSFSSYLVKCVLCFMLRHDTWTSSSSEMMYNIISQLALRLRAVDLSFIVIFDAKTSMQYALIKRFLKIFYFLKLTKKYFSLSS